MKSLLIITDVFPPLSGAGVKRILKFLKFLPRYGWRCTILTAKNENFMPLDPTLSAEVPPQTTVERTYTLESLFKQPNGSSSGVHVPNSTSRKPTSFVPSPLKLAYKHLAPILKIPDSRMLWLPSAVANGVRLCRRENVNGILATGPSFTNFLIGAGIKRLTGKPLVLDVRDAWVADPTRLFKRNYLKKIDARLERFAFNCADLVVTTNPFVTKDFIGRYPKRPSNAFDTIYNGFDPEDFPACSSNKILKTPDFFTIVHTGRLYAERTPKFFLQALGDALRIRPDIREHLRVLFVGSCETFNDGRRIEDYISEFNLSGVVLLPGQVSRRLSLDYQMEADLLLLLIGIVPAEQSLTYGISGKLFDYMGCGKPILTMANEGASRELISEKGIGALFSHDDTSAVRDHLIESFDRFASGNKSGRSSTEVFREFQLDTLISRLAGHLDVLAATER